MVSHARTRAERKGLPINITAEAVAEIISAGRCQVTNLPFDLSLVGERNLRGPSLDRVDPKKGYTMENTRVVLFGYNACKNTATPEETCKFFSDVAGALA